MEGLHWTMLSPSLRRCPGSKNANKIRKASTFVIIFGRLYEAIPALEHPKKETVLHSKPS